MKKIILTIVIAAMGIMSVAAQEINAAAAPVEVSKFDKFVEQTLVYANDANLYTSYRFTNDFVYRGLSHNSWSHQVLGGFKTDALTIVDVSADILANFGQNGDNEIQTKVAVSKDFLIYDTIKITPFVAYKNYTFTKTGMPNSDEVQAGLILDPEFYGIKASVNVFREVNNEQNEGIEGTIYRVFNVVITDKYSVNITPFVEAGISDFWSWSTIGVQASSEVYKYRTISISPTVGMCASFNDNKNMSDPISFNVGLNVKF